MSRRTPRSGFTFIELILVMGIIAVLLGLTVGFLANVGKAALAQQAAAILAESGRECQNASAGNRVATLDLEEETTPEGLVRLVVRKSLQRNVLSANFEPATETTPAWFYKADAPDLAVTAGDVDTDETGHDGSSCAVFKAPGATVDFGRRAIYAVTDGLGVEMYVRPKEGRTSTGMTLLRGTDTDPGGEVLYQLDLVRGATSDAYAVQLKLRLARPSEGGRQDTLGSLEPFVTKESVVRPGVWSHVRAVFDGRETHVFVDGLKRELQASARSGARARPEPRRFVSPKSGVVALLAGSPTSGFVGMLDTLTVTGIFRTDEDVRELRGGTVVLRPSLPIHVAFRNGRLDTTVHSGDVRVYLGNDADRDGDAWVVTFALYGSFTPPFAVPRGTVPGLPAQAAPSGATPPATTPGGMG